MDGHSYDAAGNLLYDGTHYYFYDAENHLIQVDGALGFCSTGTGTAATACYVYDAEGRRVHRTGVVTDTCDGTGKRDYVYDLAGHWLLEVNANGTACQSEIYAGGRHLVTYAGGTPLFIHSDWLGTVRRRNSATYPTYNFESCTSLPFGDGLSCSGGDQSTLHFTGKERDAESGLDNFGARYNSSSMGRFMSPDPLGGHQEDPQTMNRYTYVRNNPLNLTDPTGLDWYLGCTSSDHSGCTQLSDKDKTWVQADKSGNATIVTSDSIRNGDNSASVDQNGVHVTTGGNTYQGVYYDNPASKTYDSNGNVVDDRNPLTLQGDASKGFGGFTFTLNGNCGNTCLASGSFQFAGTPDQARAALRAAGAWDYGVFDAIDGSNLPFFWPPSRFRSI